MMDTVNHPAHYCQYGHEVIDLTERLGFCAGNAVKYILRAPYKGKPLEDLEKARWYTRRLREIDASAQLLRPWTETWDIARTFKSPAVEAVLRYCADGTEQRYRGIEDALKKLEGRRK